VILFKDYSVQRSFLFRCILTGIRTFSISQIPKRNIISDNKFLCKPLFFIEIFWLVLKLFLHNNNKWKIDMSNLNSVLVYGCNKIVLYFIGPIRRWLHLTIWHLMSRQSREISVNAEWTQKKEAASFTSCTSLR